MKAKTTKPTKTQVFNVIILDKSGSMDNMRTAAIDGFNETLAGIKKAQKRYAKTQKHFVSLLTFCGCEMRYVFDNVSAGRARKLTKDDYCPCCWTPLYDAMGITLISMRSHVAAIPDHMVVVTIITDGLENASKMFSSADIKQLVEELKNEGWTFTYMGANQNSVEVASSLSIRNSRDYIAIPQGMLGTMSKDASTRMRFYEKLNEKKEEERNPFCIPGMIVPKLTPKERAIAYAALADEAFDEEESK